MSKRISMEEFKENGCPKCGGDEFQRGPTAGLAFMLRCRCGQKFTIYPMIGVDVHEK